MGVKKQLTVEGCSPKSLLSQQRSSKQPASKKRPTDKRMLSQEPDPSSPFLGDVDLHLFGEGKHERIYEKLGAHPITHEGVKGVSFAVWAPGAENVSVVGNFNSWDGSRRSHAPPG